MRVVIAPDSFKGSIGAAEAAAALAGGWRAVRSRDEVLCVPLADGGEGTLDVLAAAVRAPAGSQAGSPARRASRWTARGWSCPAVSRPWNWPGPAGCRCSPGPIRWARTRPGSARSSAAHWTPGPARS